MPFVTGIFFFCVGKGEDWRHNACLSSSPMKWKLYCIWEGEQSLLWGSLLVGWMNYFLLVQIHTLRYNIAVVSQSPVNIAVCKYIYSRVLLSSTLLSFTMLYKKVSVYGLCVDCKIVDFYHVTLFIYLSITCWTYLPLADPYTSLWYVYSWV